ncbi:BMP family ABC transporter substrate-binding protein [Ruminococcaceae bacterium OttesenSCG-928-A16]|nr:BMP family ABC transporter substrate-binding protein [Ruminococcaceae bacterium OttesenSCG-928-A16]
MKKAMRLVAACLLVIFMFTACGPSSVSTGSTVPPSGIVPGPGQSSDAKIALIDIDGQQETGLGQAVWSAITRFAGEKGLGCNIYTATKDDFTPTLELAKKSGAEVVVMLGDELGELMEKAQREYPDLYFLLLNTTQPWQLLKNGVSQQFLVEQAGWLTGYMAVQNGLHNLGAITFAGQGKAQQQRYVLGFVLGAEAAAAALGLPQASIEIRVANLPQEATTADVQAQMKTFAAMGAKAAYIPAGSALSGLEHMAKKTGVKLLLAGTAAEDETVLFSTQKNFQPVLEEILTQWREGHFPAGQQLQSGLADGAVRPTAGALWAETVTQQTYEQAFATFEKTKAAEQLDTLIAQPAAQGLLPNPEDFVLTFVWVVLPLPEGAVSQPGSLPQSTPEAPAAASTNNEINSEENLPVEATSQVA